MTKIIRRIITKIIMRDFLKWKSWGEGSGRDAAGQSWGIGKKMKGKMGERNLFCFGWWSRLGEKCQERKTLGEAAGQPCRGTVLFEWGTEKAGGEGLGDMLRDRAGMKDGGDFLFGVTRLGEKCLERQSRIIERLIPLLTGTELRAD